MSDKIEIEIGDDGTIGTLPEPIQKFFDKKINDAYQKGADKAEKRFQSLIVDPKELESLRSKAQAHEDLQLQIAERDKNYEAAQQIRDKRWTEQIESEKQAHTNAQNVIRELRRESLRAAAVEAGAVTDKRLDALIALVEGRVDLNAGVVKGDDGQPLVDDKGEPLPFKGFFQQYLETAPEFKAAPAAKGGKAPGGATYRGTALPSGKDALRAAIDGDEGSSAKMQTAFIGSVLRKAG